MIFGSVTKFCKFNFAFHMRIPVSRYILSAAISSGRIITREMQSINGARFRVLDSSFERIAFKTFES